MADNGKLDKNQKKIKKRLDRNNRYALFLGAGSGKTRIALEHLLETLDRKKKVNALIVSTKASVLTTWPDQLKERMHATGVKVPFVVMHPEYKQVIIPGRNCQFTARITITSFDLVRKLLWQYSNDYYDYIIVDETVKIKNWNSKATRIVLSFAEKAKWCYAMSGLPTPNKIQDLFTQAYLIDGGDRLGVSIGAFRKQFMEQSEYSRFVWNPKGYPNVKEMEKTEATILGLITDICVTEETETFVKKLPKPDYQIIEFELKPKELKRYKKFERKSVLSVDKKNVAASSAAVLRGKLLQYVSGNIYEQPDPDDIEAIQNSRKANRPFLRTTKERRRALHKLLKEVYKPGDKLIIAYGFKHSKADILKVLREFVPLKKVFIVGAAGNSTADIMKRWNAHHVDIIVTHAASIGHSLNLQEHGGSILFYSMTDNYDHYYQLIRRILRRGNPFKKVRVYMLACKGTADYLVVRNIYSKAALGRRVMSSSSILSTIRAAVLKGH